MSCPYRLIAVVSKPIDFHYKDTSYPRILCIHHKAFVICLVYD